MRKVMDIIEQKQKALDELKSESNRALDVVTSTINQLSEVN